jgi:phage protein U
MESVQQWYYAEQRVIESTPRLQWIGTGLQTVTIGMLFHQSFTDPAGQLAALIGAASDHQARALVFSNGTHEGYFVINAIRTVQKHMSDAGDPISIKVNVELKQWALGAELNPSAAPVPPFIPIAVVPAAVGIPTGPLTYSPPVAGGPTLTSYEPPLLAAPGLSSMLVNPAASGAPTAVVRADDIMPSTIVRAAV